MTAPDRRGFDYRRPGPSDAAAIHRLVQESGGLDTNSLYMYALVADRFGDTCVVAERDGEVVGFVIAFVPPRSPRTLFVWQIGVAPGARGRGLAAELLDHVIGRPACTMIRFLEATVTPSNAASRALFAGFARRRRAALTRGGGYRESLFGALSHEQEELVRIGPFDPAEAAS